MFNPYATSRIAGFFAIRLTITFALCYFNTYSAVQTRKDVYTLIHGWIALGVLAALYGMYQEFIGLPSFDYEWATVDEFRYRLLFVWGKLRKFSFFMSPSEFGIVMAYTGIACVIPAFFLRQKLESRILYGILSLIMIVSMMSSGSRTAMVLCVVGIFIFAALTLWRNVLLMVVAVAFLGLVFVVKPTSNKSLKVMFTAFEGADDASMNVRLMNQKIIREYIKSHPLGFGIGSTGHYGVKYSPDTFIGSFPPDSELVKIAIETGWVGLILWSILLFSIYYYGINAYFKSKDQELKALMTVPLVLFFMMIIGQYPQECFRAPVLASLFSITIGLIAKFKGWIDKE
jgi:O-antigen ligase